MIKFSKYINIEEQIRNDKADPETDFDFNVINDYLKNNNFKQINNFINKSYFGDLYNFIDKYFFMIITTIPYQKNILLKKNF